MIAGVVKLETQQRDAVCTDAEPKLVGRADVRIVALQACLAVLANRLARAVLSFPSADFEACRSAVADVLNERRRTRANTTKLRGAPTWPLPESIGLDNGGAITLEWLGRRSGASPHTRTLFCWDPDEGAMAVKTWDGGQVAYERDDPRIGEQLNRWLRALR